MDSKLLEQKQLAERYVFGRLSPPEARFFESVLRRAPDLAEQLQLPAALQRTMRLLDETGTEWRERPDSFWHKPWFAPALGCTLVVVLVILGFTVAARHRLTVEVADLQAAAEHGMLNPPTRSQSVDIAAVHPGEAQTTYEIGNRASPSLAELRINVGYAKASLYRVVLQRDDGIFWGRIDNLVRDSNGQLRMGLNTDALATGTYNLEVDAVDLRGDGAEIGRAQLHVAPH